MSDFAICLNGWMKKRLKIQSNWSRFRLQMGGITSFCVMCFNNIFINTKWCIITADKDQYKTKWNFSISFSKLWKFQIVSKNSGNYVKGVILANFEFFNTKTVVVAADERFSIIVNYLIKLMFILNCFLYCNLWLLFT